MLLIDDSYPDIYASGRMTPDGLLDENFEDELGAAAP
ncbi:unnamed protein product, partial [Protopolystoma xenopodis]